MLKRGGVWLWCLAINSTSHPHFWRAGSCHDTHAQTLRLLQLLRSWSSKVCHHNHNRVQQEVVLMTRRGESMYGLLFCAKQTTEHKIYCFSHFRVSGSAVLSTFLWLCNRAQSLFLKCLVVANSSSGGFFFFCQREIDRRWASHDDGSAFLRRLGRGLLWLQVRFYQEIFFVKTKCPGTWALHVIPALGR